MRLCGHSSTQAFDMDTLQEERDEPLHYIKSMRLGAQKSFGGAFMTVPLVIEE